MEYNSDITLSIVSHGQSALIISLLSDLANLSNQRFEVFITVNVPEDESCYQGHVFPIRIIRNNAPKGFGANHNAAFKQSSSPWFAVVNPDIRLKALDLQTLLKPFQDKSIAAVAPVVLSHDGKVEDSARQFPTLMRFAKRLILGIRNADYQVESTPYPVDWVAGMFVVFRRDAYQQIAGFDDRRFFMYLEDADICRRLGLNGWQVVVNPEVQVIHMAQRASRKNLKHLRWHTVSALRFLTGL
ncbi:MAG: hypothetical protein RL517_1206 [Pseudomonadota bacterium]|jgi:GT2 family glycosyltransferase